MGATILDEQAGEKVVERQQQEAETLHNHPEGIKGFCFGLSFRKACFVLILLSHPFYFHLCLLFLGGGGGDLLLLFFIHVVCSLIFFLVTSVEYRPL